MSVHTRSRTCVRSFTVVVAACAALLTFAPAPAGATPAPPSAPTNDPVAAGETIVGEVVRAVAEQHDPATDGARPDSDAGADGADGSADVGPATVRRPRTGADRRARRGAAGRDRRGDRRRGGARRGGRRTRAGPGARGTRLHGRRRGRDAADRSGGHRHQRGHGGDGSPGRFRAGRDHARGHGRPGRRSGGAVLVGADGRGEADRRGRSARLGLDDGRLFGSVRAVERGRLPRRVRLRPGQAPGSLRAAGRAGMRGRPGDRRFGSGHRRLHLLAVRGGFRAGARVRAQLRAVALRTDPVRGRPGDRHLLDGRLRRFLRRDGRVLGSVRNAQPGAGGPDRAAARRSGADGERNRRRRHRDPLADLGERRSPGDPPGRREQRFHRRRWHVLPDDVLPGVPAGRGPGRVPREPCPELVRPAARRPPAP